MLQGNRGYTLVETMITVAVAGISLALAVPSWNSVVEKRMLTSAAEELKSFIVLAQSEAVKRNDEVTLSWYTPGSHSEKWCIGATLGDTACDCRETVSTEPDFCAIEGVEQKYAQDDFVDMNFEFMHMNPTSGSFSFDPVRGTIVNLSSSEIIDDDYLFYLHSNKGSGSTREYELELRLNVTGRTRLCTDKSRKSIIAGYPEC